MTAQRKRIAINFGSGYVPGLNSVVTGVVRAAGRLGWEVVGIHDGYDGLFHQEQYADGGTIALTPSLADVLGGPDFEPPVYIFNGEFDTITPTEFALSYFETIEAPDKAFVVLNGAGHSAVLTHPDLFLRELNAHLRTTPQWYPAQPYQ